MYDVIVVGQGLSGLLSAIWAKQQGKRTALAAMGTGRIIQSSGVMDSIPGTQDWQGNPIQKGAIEAFKRLTEKMGYPYKGEIENPISIVTGAGHVKKTILYPATISPIPEQGRVVIVGFDHILDFQPTFVQKNLQKARPTLMISTLTVQLRKHSQRTLTQLDAARLLDQSEVRNDCIRQIQQQMYEKNISQPDLFIFPASLGMEKWQETIEHFSTELNAKVTEAPGMPPNATAIRLHERLKKEAVQLGVRFYENTVVFGCKLDGKIIDSLIIKNGSYESVISGKEFILATGGILGGGLEQTSIGLKETALGFETNESGELLYCPSNLYPVGASNGLRVIHHGITGGVYSILSAHEAIAKIGKNPMMGGTRSA
ncbi:MAG: FAD-binding protein [Bacillota bacterium]|nr:FAD-binding protein [Bacillota bacterium]